MYGFGFFCKLVAAEPMFILDCVSLLSIKQNLKNVRENYLKWDYLQSGLVFLSHSVMCV